MSDKRNELLAKLESVKDLPTLPQVVMSFQSELATPYCDASKITRIVAEDPAIVAKILKIANSALFRVDKEIVDVQKAIVRIGFYEVYNIVLAMSTIALFSNCKNIDYKRFWSHSISVGFGTGALAGFCGNGKKPLNEPAKMTAFSAGLLHDMGLLVLDLYFPDKYRELAERMATEKSKTLWQIEDEVLGVNHAEIGGVLMKKWGIPDGVMAGVLYQRHPEDSPAHSQIAALVQLSNSICNDLGYENGISHPTNYNLDATWALLDIPKDRVGEIKAIIKAEAEKSPILFALS